jgi:hypothetical protein
VEAVGAEALIGLLALEESQARQSTGKEHSQGIARVCPKIVATVKIVLHTCASHQSWIGLCSAAEEVPAALDVAAPSRWASLWLSLHCPGHQEELPPHATGQRGHSDKVQGLPEL